MSEEGTITIRKDSLWKYSTFILLAVLIVGAFVFFTKGNATGSTVTGNSVGTDTTTQPTVVPTVDDDPMLGDKNAKVTIIEFSDYQCPFCRKFWTETYGQLKKDYIDTGKVRLVFRDFPLSFHPLAIPAAEAAECVREKGGDAAYFKMHDKMFQEQNKLDGGDPMTGPVKSTVFDGWGKDALKKWAKDLGYDIGSCLDSEKYKSEIEKDAADGSASGVSGTPAFFINGKLLSGAYPYSEFKKIIDAAL